jgi:hypothetical protein
MSRTLEVPDELYERLEKAAAEVHKTPLEYLDYALPSREEFEPLQGSLYDLIRDHIGVFNSGGIENMKEDPNDPLLNILLEKKRKGTL